MSKKSNIKTPLRVSNILPKVFKKLKKNNGTLLFEIKMNWGKIVKQKYCDICFVSSLKYINNKNILTVVSNNRNILELSFSSNEIKERINNYYNSPVIDEIKFKKVLQY